MGLERVYHLDCPSRSADRSYLVNAAPVVDGSHILGVTSSFDDHGQSLVTVVFDADGATRLEGATAANVGKVFPIMIDDELLLAPLVQEAIPGGKLLITMGTPEADTASIARVLRAGALPCPLTLVDTAAP